MTSKCYTTTHVAIEDTYDIIIFLRDIVQLGINGHHVTRLQDIFSTVLRSWWKILCCWYYRFYASSYITPDSEFTKLKANLKASMLSWQCYEFSFINTLVQKGKAYLNEQTTNIFKEQWRKNYLKMYTSSSF